MNKSCSIFLINFYCNHSKSCHLIFEEYLYRTNIVLVKSCWVSYLIKIHLMKELWRECVFNFVSVVWCVRRSPGAFVRRTESLFWTALCSTIKIMLNKKNRLSYLVILIFCSIQTLNSIVPGYGSHAIILFNHARLRLTPPCK